MEKNSNGRKCIGLISDTHGMVPDAALNALEGVDAIIHAGDIGGPEVLGVLANIAHVYAVRGNMDQGKWASVLPPTDLIHIGDTFFYVLHDLQKIDLDPSAAGVHAVVHGHTHQPSSRRVDDVLYINPGSAGHPRFGNKPTIVRLEINGPESSTRFVELV